MMLVSVNSVQKSYGYFFDIFELVSVVVFALFLFIPNKAPFLIYFHYMGDPVILASKSAAWFEGRAHHVAPGGERPTTSCHSAIRVLREASANPSKSNRMLYSVSISRTEQCPTLFGQTNTQACGRRDVQWKLLV